MIIKWFKKQRELNIVPVSEPYTFQYSLGELPLPQPWRQNCSEKVYFLPSTFVLNFVDRGRMSLLRVSEPEQLASLGVDMLEFGIKYPLEMWMDPSGKLRLQEGHHRMCIVQENLNRFPRVPILFRESAGKIRSYGRSVVEEFKFVLETIERAKLYE